MKLFIGAALALITILGVGVYNARADETLRTQAVNPVYKIISNGAICSATAIKLPPPAENANTFLTAKHCINPENPVGKLIDETVTENSESSNYYDFKVVMVSKSSDLIGLVVPSEDFHPQRQ
jgi:hypothetical protein